MIKVLRHAFVLVIFVGLLGSFTDKINTDPYGEGWIAKIEPSNLDGDLANLMDAVAYAEYLKTL